MPKIYRAMYEQGGKPRVGDAWCELGVRPPGRLKANGKPETNDVDLDANGDVVLNRKGMSVFRSLADLPRLYLKLVPIHLSDKVRGAAGMGGMRLWSMGQGPFSSSALTGQLKLDESGGMHGNVCPGKAMPLAEFQSELANTQESWTIDEP
jgi:hypothetical protein